MYSLLIPISLCKLPSRLSHSSCSFITLHSLLFMLLSYCFPHISTLPSSCYTTHFYLPLHSPGKSHIWGSPSLACRRECSTRHWHKCWKQSATAPVEMHLAWSCNPLLPKPLASHQWLFGISAKSGSVWEGYMHIYRRKNHLKIIIWQYWNMYR